ncbi:uncharacterized protein LOC141649112 [Silene latifolia]|uniref:uncharacterized protein LOC141649112 n=1 Tax=Silene latifolia TaxID=37657 RepID=UPI003D785D84
MDTPEKPLQFKSLFVSFYAQFRGVIEECRSLIGVDGTHLKRNHGGVLLSAIAVDGNNEIFPVAVGVVEAENKESWSQFFYHLKQVLSESGREDWTIISDRQKGIEPALDQIWPSSYRRFCARHLCKNFKKDYSGILMHKLFWKIVNAHSEFVFKKALDSLCKNFKKDYPVSLTNRTCKCGQWQITGIPCKHGIRAIITANRDPEAYVSEWFTVAKYKVAYGLSILPIPDSE